MSRRLPPLNQIRVFEAAARHCHVRRAAEELNVTPSAVSHQIKALEAYFGFPLFELTKMRLRLTEQGQFLLPAVEQALDLIAGRVGQLTMPRLEGPITIYAPPAFAARWLVRHLGSFTAAYPTISPVLKEVRPFPASLPADFDVLIEYGRGHWEHRWVRLLSRVEFFPVCSPKLLSGEGGALRHPRDLKRFTLLHDDDGLGWSHWLAAAGAANIETAQGMRFASASHAIDAAEMGLGLALCDDVLAAGDIAAGRLVQPFEMRFVGPGAYYAVCNPDRLQTGIVQAFLQWMFAEIDTPLEI
jgi:LysR family glycine cleavage system transcriptional activator